MTTGDSVSAGRTAVRPGYLLIGLLLLAVNLRTGLVGYPPLLDTVRGALGISAGLAGLVQASALVMMGVASFLAPLAAALLGWEKALGAAVGVLAAGSLLRAVPTLAGLIAGSVLVGLGIGGAGVLIAGVVKRHMPDRAGTVTGGYVTVMMVGAGITGAVAVPLAVGLGGWSFSLAVWSVPAALASGLWWPVARRSSTDRAERGPSGALPWRDPFARLATLYLATSSVQFYGWLTWLAPYYEHLGWSAQGAAVLQAVWATAQIPVALGVSALAQRSGRWTFWAALSLICGVLGIAGALVLPIVPVLGPWPWVVLNAVGAATGFPLGLTVIAWLTRGAAAAGSTSGMALGVGYVLAGIAPLLMGVLLDVTGGFRVPLGLLVLAGVLQLVAVALIGKRHMPSARSR